MEIKIEQTFLEKTGIPCKITIDSLDLKNKEQIETIRKFLNELETNWVTDLKADEKRQQNNPEDQNQLPNAYKALYDGGLRVSYKDFCQAIANLHQKSKNETHPKKVEDAVSNDHIDHE